jgi:MtfA peptidase
MPGVELTRGRLLLAAQAQLPLLNLGELDWYQGFHEIVLYPDDFRQPPAPSRRQRSGTRMGRSSQRRSLAARPGDSGLAGRAGQRRLGRLQPGDPRTGAQARHAQWRRQWHAALHSSMQVSDWTQAMQAAYDHLNHYLDHHNPDHAPIDPYAAENPAEFFAVTSEYFFSAPDLLLAMPTRWSTGN